MHSKHHSGTGIGVWTWGVYVGGSLLFSLCVVLSTHSSEQAGCGVSDTLQKVVNQLSEAVR